VSNHDPINLAVIVGSVRDGRFGPVTAAWIAGRAAEHGGFATDVIDLADFDIPLALPPDSPKHAGDATPRPDGLRPLTGRLAAADAFVVVTPEYNHSFPASLKAAIDWHFPQWAAKPVALVSYGSTTGGRHAAAHLENVFTELNAVTVREGLSFPRFWENWHDGRPDDLGAVGDAKFMLDQLAWWAAALRDARAKSPYPGT
jgi:NAD(P)H-dependent FMN reductase